VCQGDTQQVELDGTRELLAYSKDFILFDKHNKYYTQKQILL
jgi:hypothetical protein